MKNKFKYVILICAVFYADVNSLSQIMSGSICLNDIVLCIILTLFGAYLLFKSLVGYGDKSDEGAVI